MIAEVKINGKDLGILWKPPFRVDVTAAFKPAKTNWRSESSICGPIGSLAMTLFLRIASGSPASWTAK